MKTYLTLFLLLFVYALSFGQVTNTGFRVTKEYDKEGNLIRYDSTRISKQKSFRMDFNHSLHDTIPMDFEWLKNSLNSRFIDSLFMTIQHPTFFPKNEWMEFTIDWPLLKKEQRDSILLERLEERHRFLKEKIDRLKKKKGSKS